MNDDRFSFEPDIAKYGLEVKKNIPANLSISPSKLARNTNSQNTKSNRNLGMYLTSELKSPSINEMKKINDLNKQKSVKKCKCFKRFYY